MWKPINDGDDIEQRGLIFLWNKWQQDSAWLRQATPAYLGTIAFFRGKNDCFHYRSRRGNHVNEGVPLLESEKGDEVEKPPTDPFAVKETHLPLRDRPLANTERRIDISCAVEATIKELCEAEERRCSNGQVAPVETIVRTICTAFMYHSGQTVRKKKGTSSDGNMGAFWRQHITEKQWYKWKPRVLSTLAKHLEGYGTI